MQLGSARMLFVSLCLERDVKKAQGNRNSFVIRRSFSDLPEMHLKCIGCFHCISVSSCVMSTCAETLQFVQSLAVAVPFLSLWSEHACPRVVWCT